MAPQVYHLMLLTLHLAAGIEGLVVLSTSVPHQVGHGQDATLRCRFVLGEKEVLYAVKWFKGSHQFFDYLPANKPPLGVFPLAGLTVDMARSNESQVTLLNIQYSNAGTYRCEVTIEYEFVTDSKEANMSVIDLPVQGPIIVNVQNNYRSNELVSLNCTSSPSRPMARLQWYINGVPAPTQYVRKYVDGSQQTSVSSSPYLRSDTGHWLLKTGRPAVSDESDMALVGLEFHIESWARQRAAMQVINVTCVALVGDIYKNPTHAKLIVIDRNALKPVVANAAAATIRPPAHLAATGGGHSPCYTGYAWFLLVTASTYRILE